MHGKIIGCVLITAGVAHLLPLSGLLSSARLAALYDVAIPDKNLEILLRHRAVLFGILGLFLIYAAFNSAVQLGALIAAFVSLSSFLGLAWTVGEYNQALRKVVFVDIAILLSVFVGTIIYFDKGS